MTVQTQLDQWVAGHPVHNPTRDECCPDFSCCNPALLAPAETRRQFAAAGKAERNSMLMEFLGKLLRYKGCDVMTSQV